MKIILPSLNIFFERWKYNKEYKVFVSNRGNFKNKHKENMAIKIDSRGYVILWTCRGYVLAHRLVMYTWRPIADRESMTVDHLNHNKRDNTLINLEWVTKEENCERAKRDFVQIGDLKIANASIEDSTIEINPSMLRNIIRKRKGLSLLLNREELLGYLASAEKLIRKEAGQLKPKTRAQSVIEAELNKAEEKSNSFILYNKLIKKIDEGYKIRETNPKMAAAIVGRGLITKERREEIINEEKRLL